MRRILIPFLTALMLIGAAAATAIAAEVDEVAAAATSDGFFVERGSSITEQQAGLLVGEMRNAGEGFILVALSTEPPAGATTFADNVQRAIGSGLVFVVAPESLGFAGEGDVFNEDELENALDAAFDVVGSDYDLAAAFVGELLGVPVVATPEPVTATTAAPSLGTGTEGTAAPEPSGGGGSGFLWFVIIVGGLGLVLWWLMRRSKSKAQEVDAERLSQARYLIQEQLNDVANDILAMEDEVRVADNDRASRFYEQAGETYNEVSERIEETKTAQGLVDLSNKLDVAIWQLDTAEAILDDKPLPERPEPKRLEPPPRTAAPPSRQPVPGPSSYQRRPQRKSSLGGGGLMDLLIVVGGGLLNSRRRSSTSRSSRSGGGGLGGGLGDLFGRRSGSTPQQPRTPTPRPPASSGDRSNPLPGPGRRATPSPPTRSSMPKSSRQGTSGRVRSGRRRRKK